MNLQQYIILVTVSVISFIQTDASPCNVCDNGQSYDLDLVESDVVRNICRDFQNQMNAISVLGEDACRADSIAVAIQNNKQSCKCPIPETLKCDLCPDGADPVYANHKPDIIITTQSGSLHQVPCSTLKATMYEHFQEGSAECLNVQAFRSECGCPGTTSSNRAETTPQVPQAEPKSSQEYPACTNGGGCSDPLLSCDLRLMKCTNYLTRAKRARSKRRSNGRGGQRAGSPGGGRRNLLRSTNTKNWKNDRKQDDLEEYVFIELPPSEDFEDELKFLEDNEEHMVDIEN